MFVAFMFITSIGAYMAYFIATNFMEIT